MRARSRLDRAIVSRTVRSAWASAAGDPGRSSREGSGVDGAASARGSGSVAGVPVLRGAGGRGVTGVTAGAGTGASGATATAGSGSSGGTTARAGGSGTANGGAIGTLAARGFAQPVPTRSARAPITSAAVGREEKGGNPAICMHGIRRLWPSAAGRGTSCPAQACFVPRCRRRAAAQSGRPSTTRFQCHHPSS